jgi:hypothetical protein
MLPQLQLSSVSTSLSTLSQYVSDNLPQRAQDFVQQNQAVLSYMVLLAGNS